jgi:hypothetical protein
MLRTVFSVIRYQEAPLPETATGKDYIIIEPIWHTETATPPSLKIVTPAMARESHSNEPVWLIETVALSAIKSSLPATDPGGLPNYRAISQQPMVGKARLKPPRLQHYSDHRSTDTPEPSQVVSGRLNNSTLVEKEAM